MSVKPTLVLVHGAFHGPECFHLIQPKLEALGCPVVAVALVSVGRTHPTATYLDDAAAINEVMLPILDEGNQIVMVAHSWGGIPGVASIVSQSIQERSARGEKGGVKSIMMIAAATILKKGKSLADTTGSNSVDWLEMDGTLGICIEAAKDVFYHDLPPAEQDHYFSLLRPHAMTTFFTPVDTIAADLAIPKAYVICEKDHAVPIERQEKMVKEIGGFKVIRFAGGHLPFLTEPDWTVKTIDEYDREN
ncbi:uncharacterized protein RSE6_11691 [Rhynchosporium secalis]|uniref:AB hydrolase-1 domain-containing protein n=1 Tax=Rhynchosporium secalis TaxID=38038 RepID=A0A1E1MNN4_RHYSE|nr:uncharacterized protein RSE6_11691 [Rhynchosporium secalis]